MREEDYILPELDNNLFKPVLNASVKDYEKRKGSMPKPLLNELKTLIAQNVLPKEINDILKTKLKRI